VSGRPLLSFTKCVAMELKSGASHGVARRQGVWVKSPEPDVIKHRYSTVELIRI
jgi:hypothetical protein